LTVFASAPSHAEMSRAGAASTRTATQADAPAIAAIYNHGIEERQATFQTHHHGADDFRERIADSTRPLLVAEADGKVVGWAGVVGYSDSCAYYSGVGEATLYVDRSARRAGVGSTLLGALAGEAERRGFYKLVGKIFTTNAPSIELVRRCGWSEVGVHRRHGRLDGEWRDVLVVEKLLNEAELEPPSDPERTAR
jgi:L-amino acid N-acyltransferase YncA